MRTEYRSKGRMFLLTYMFFALIVLVAIIPIVSANDARLVSSSYGSAKSDVDIRGFGLYVVILLLCYIIFRVVLKIVHSNMRKQQDPDGIAYAETESSNYNLEKEVVSNAFGTYDSSQDREDHFESKLDSFLDQEMVRKQK